MNDFVGCPSHMYISLRDVFYVPIATLKVCKLFQDVSTILNIEMIHLLKTHKIDLCSLVQLLAFICRFSMDVLIDGYDLACLLLVFVI